MLLAGFIVLGVLYVKGWRHSLRTLAVFAGTFALVGLFLLWRWNYFGYPLPNAFYRKGGGRFYPASLQASIENVLIITPIPVAQMLKDYRDKSCTIATTESGLLPFFSGWRAVDTYGLNDLFIAHNGLVTREYLQQQNPHVIVMNTNFCPLNTPRFEEMKGDVQGIRNWGTMVGVVYEYAVTQKYVLAAAYGTQMNRCMYYFVRPDFADSAEIVERIRGLRSDPTVSEAVIDFARSGPPVNEMAGP